MRTQGYIGAVPPFSGPGMSAGLWSLNDSFILRSQNRWHSVYAGADSILQRVAAKIAANGTSNAANDNKVNLGPTLPNDVFRGCVLMQDGRVFLVASDGTSARIYNPTTDTLTTPTGTYPGSGAFYGGVLLPDGRVFCVPFNSTSARIYNPSTDTLTTPTGTYPGNYSFIGGVLLPDGRVFCGPRAAGMQFMAATGDWSTAQKCYDGDILLSFLYNKY